MPINIDSSIQMRMPLLKGKKSYPHTVITLLERIGVNGPAMFPHLSRSFTKIFMLVLMLFFMEKKRA